MVTFQILYADSDQCNSISPCLEEGKVETHHDCSLMQINQNSVATSTGLNIQGKGPRRAGSCSSFIVGNVTDRSNKIEKGETYEGSVYLCMYRECE